MAKTIVLPNPEPATTEYRVQALELWMRPWRVSVLLESDTGKSRRVEWGGVEAKDMILTLNRLDLRTITLEERVLRAIANRGDVEGTVGGETDTLTVREQVDLNGIEVVPVADLPAFLATEDDPDQIRRWQEEDTRSTADVHYEARLAELEPEPAPEA